MDDDMRTVRLPVDDEDAIRQLKAELRAARHRLREERRAAASAAFRALPSGGTNLGGH